MIGTRIENIRKTLGLSQVEMAKRFSVSQTAISQWEKGQREPDIETIMKIAEMGKCTLDWLISGKESLTPPLTYLDDPSGIKRAEGFWFPVVAKVTAGDFQIFEDNVLEETFFPCKKRNGYFSVIVEGDSMEGGNNPICQGDYVLVAPDETPLVGDVVVVLTSGRQMVKQLKGRNKDQIELRSFNPEYPPIFIPEDEIEKILRVIMLQKWKKL